MALSPTLKRLLVAGVLLGVAGGGYAWYSMFYVDPEFAAADKANQEQQESLDQQLGLDSAEDDFADLEEELEGPK